jgi:hypothetical protein
MSSVTPFGDRLWILSGDDVRMFRIPFSTRMTIVQLASGDLWLHSPVAPTPDRLAAVQALGPVAHLVAPNLFHNLGIASWKAQHPTATTWVSPRFQRRSPRLPADHVLDDHAPAAWRDEIEQHVFRGSRILDEVIFLHRQSRTLLVTDLIQRHDPHAESPFWRVVKGLAGVLGDAGGVSRDLRLTFRDRKAARRSAEHVLAWDFDRMVISHGSCVHANAKESVARAFAWLL